MYRGTGRVRLHMGVDGARLCAVVQVEQGYAWGAGRVRLCIGVQV